MVYGVVIMTVFYIVRLRNDLNCIRMMVKFMQRIICRALMLLALRCFRIRLRARMMITLCCLLCTLMVVDGRLLVCCWNGLLNVVVVTLLFVLLKECGYAVLLRRRMWLIVLFPSNLVRITTSRLRLLILNVTTRVVR